MTEVVLIRGVAGSGKTTMAKQQFPDHEHFEADMFFEKEEGYCYDASLIKDAHEWCNEKTAEALKQGKNVVVSNTFIRIWEMNPYFNMNVPVRVLVAEGNYDNIHDIPKEKVERMKERFEPFNK